MSAAVQTAVARLADGDTLAREELTAAFQAILSGEADPALIAAFLMGLRMRGETAEDILAGASVMRAHARKVDAPEGVIDTCGTGGLGWTSLNTSTASALTAAGAGATVAKHGNRSVPPKTGSADVLEALGVNLTPNDQQIAACFARARVAFLFAPAHHSAMKYVAPVRKTLAVRTIFNLLGPLSNPAGAKRQVLGVFDARWVEPYAKALAGLGSERAFVVHGRDGLDEISTIGTTLVAELANGGWRTYELEPEALGLKRASKDALRGGDPASNAAALTRTLNGEPGPFADLIAANAAAALVVAGLAGDLKEGVELARRSIADGRAANALAELKAASHG